MDALVAVLGTLLGGFLGATGTYINQRSVHRLESDDRLSTLRRQVYLAYLVAVHEMFVPINDVHRALHAGSISAAEATRQLRDVSARIAQTALEDVRLVASDPVASVAAQLWSHMRRDGSPVGQDLSWSAFGRWRNEYWTTRRSVIDAARQDIGFAPLDWDTAGVG